MTARITNPFSFRFLPQEAGCTHDLSLLLLLSLYGMLIAMHEGELRTIGLALESGVSIWYLTAWIGRVRDMTSVAHGHTQGEVHACIRGEIIIFPVCTRLRAKQIVWEPWLHSTGYAVISFALPSPKQTDSKQMEGCNGGGEIDIMCEVSSLNIQLYNYALFMPFGTFCWGEPWCHMQPQAPRHTHPALWLQRHPNHAWVYFPCHSQNPFRSTIINDWSEKRISLRLPYWSKLD